MEGIVFCAIAFSCFPVCLLHVTLTKSGASWHMRVPGIDRGSTSMAGSSSYQPQVKPGVFYAVPDQAEPLTQRHIVLVP